MHALDEAGQREAMPSGGEVCKKVLVGYPGLLMRDRQVMTKPLGRLFHSPVFAGTDPQQGKHEVRIMKEWVFEKFLHRRLCLPYGDAACGCVAGILGTWEEAAVFHDG